MTSSMTSQGGLKVGPLYSFINEITTFFMITKQRAKISSLNFLCICIMRLWLQLYKYIFMTSLMTSPGHKVGQILKLTYLRQYLNTASIWPQIWKDRPKWWQKSIFMMTSSMTSQGGLNVGPLYSFINEITTFFMITKKRAKISSSNFLCICIMRLWL